MIRRFKLLDRIGNRNGATVEIEQVGHAWLFRVRPKGLRKVYTYRLADVADMVCYRAAKEEARRRP
ncbi:MAG TPA: hypothetical protein VMZ92_12135 [Planctomycetota bacterium]|nr:hypothetical protein [Planctomycetota bacterium]